MLTSASHTSLVPTPALSTSLPSPETHQSITILSYQQLHSTTPTRCARAHENIGSIKVVPLMALMTLMRDWTVHEGKVHVRPHRNRVHGRTLDVRVPSSLYETCQHYASHGSKPKANKLTQSRSAPTSMPPPPVFPTEPKYCVKGLAAPCMPCCAPLPAPLTCM